MIELDTLHCLDLFDLCAALPDRSIDMILCDLPYGTTACSWDTVIPFDPMWAAFRRVIKQRGAIVLTASQPFTSRLVCSALDLYRHSWVWHKNNSAGWLNASIKPLPVTEDILVFSADAVNYYPIMDTRGKPRYKGGYSKSDVYGNIIPLRTLSDTYFPKSLLVFPNAVQNDKEHPTQKPVALFEYLIRTYTQPGDVVLDPCVGSGTTAVAARKTDRRYICGDKSQEYVDIARKRLQDSDPFLPTQHTNGMTQRSLFEGIE